MSSLIDRPEELFRFIRAIVSRKFRHNVDDFVSCGILGVLKHIDKIDRTRSELEIRRYVYNAAMNGARRNLDHACSILTTCSAIQNQGQATKELSRKISWAISGRRRVMRTRNPAWFGTPDVPIVDFQPDHRNPVNVADRIDAKACMSRIPKNARDRLLVRYRGASIESVAQSHGISRLEARMIEVRDLRKVGAL